MNHNDGRSGRGYDIDLALARKQKAEPKRANPRDMALTVCANLLTIGMILGLIAWAINTIN